MTPVFGALVCGLLPRAVREPQGNPFGSGLFVRNGGIKGAFRVPHNEALHIERQ
jgi:hypothetical protein